MINPAKLDELKERLQSMVVNDLGATIAALKEALPNYSSIYEKVLNLEGQYNELENEKLEQLISRENEVISSNRIRSSLIRLITGLEASHFSKFSPKRIGFAKILGIVVAFLTIALLLIFGFDDQVKGTEENVMPDKESLAIIPPDKTGFLLYQVPDKMQLEEEAECVVRIAFDSIKLLKQIIRENINLEVIETSDYMQVELVNTSLKKPAFDVQPVFQNQDKQFIQNEKFSEWRFSVTPLKEGVHELTIVVTIFAEVNGQYFPSKRSFQENIEIVTTPVEPEVFAFKTGKEVISSKSAASLDSEILEMRYIDYREGDSKNANDPAEQTVVELEQKVSITFSLNSTAPIMSEDARSYLQSLVNTVNRSGGAIIIVGHTDDVGPFEYNQNLGFRRATAVSDLLVRLGAHPAAIRVQSKGETYPVAPNSTPEGRRQNRRVEIRLVR
jgi:outer membrane protein OmpA-like peptidoglycan-associated protein